MSKPAGKGGSGAASGGGEDGQAQELLHDLVNDGDGPEDDSPEARIARLEQERDNWKASSRKHEERNRVLKPAADELAELKKSSQTVEEQLAAATKRGDDLQAKIDRLEVAREYGLADNDEVTALLGSGSREDLEARAEQLARLVNNQKAPEGDQNGQAGNGRGGFGTPEEAAAAAGVGRGRRPVEGLRAGGTPGSGTAGGPGESPNDLFRGLLDR